MIYFMVCGDEVRGRAECLRRGYVQVGVDRFYTPARDDVRLVRRFTDVALLPGGTVFMAGPGFWENREAERFVDLVEMGAARWLYGEDPGLRTGGRGGAAVLTPVEAPAEEGVLTEPEAMGPMLPVYTGARRGRPPLRR